MWIGSCSLGIHALHCGSCIQDPRRLAEAKLMVLQVLTTRIAYLILVHKIPPWAICAVTFTNKAANEMRERLTKLIGKPSTKQLKMGTFHALCARFLRQHATLVGLSENFTILDADERYCHSVTRCVVVALTSLQREAHRQNDEEGGVSRDATGEQVQPHEA